MTDEKGVPLNTSAGTVPAFPENVGIPAGHAIVGAVTLPDGVPALTLDVVALDPVNGSAGTVPPLPVKI